MKPRLIIRRNPLLGIVWLAEWNGHRVFLGHVDCLSPQQALSVFLSHDVFWPMAGLDPRQTEGIRLQ